MEAPCEDLATRDYSYLGLMEHSPMTSNTGIFSAFKSVHIEDSDSLLYRPWPSLHVPSRIV